MTRLTLDDWNKRFPVPEPDPVSEFDELMVEADAALVAIRAEIDRVADPATRAQLQAGLAAIEALMGVGPEDSP